MRLNPSVKCTDQDTYINTVKMLDTFSKDIIYKELIRLSPGQPDAVLVRMVHHLIRVVPLLHPITHPSTVTPSTSEHFHLHLDHVYRFTPTLRLIKPLGCVHELWARESAAARRPPRCNRAVSRPWCASRRKFRCRPNCRMRRRACGRRGASRGRCCARMRWWRLR
jgi:hypothetical protein